MDERRMKTGDMQDGWKENEDRRHAERHDIFPEDNTVDRITKCR